VTVLWGLGAVALLIWFLWNSQRYWTAKTRAEQVSSVASGSELPSEPGEKAAWWMVRRQVDPALESMRRRVWLAFAVWVLYALLGDAFWRALVHWLSG
jgi:hypothetical protein